MKTITNITRVHYILVLILLNLSAAAATDYSSGLLIGYNSGPGLHVFGKVAGFSQDLPISVHIGLGYTSLEAGNPADARRIFINDATNGIPKKSGRLWDFRLDVLFPVHWFGWNRTFLSIGPRYGLFTSNFKYLGGNEDFDVTCHQWGWGVGLEKQYRMTGSLNLLLSGGLDYFLPNSLLGHDTSYSPDGTIVNGRKDYTYDDADKAIGQPGFIPRFMAGMVYYFDH